MDTNIDKKKFNLEDRLVKFSLKILELEEKIKRTRAGVHIASQIMRSGTSPAFNYGEARVAESLNDFVHKMRICLKELKETGIILRIIYEKPLTNDPELVKSMIKECGELIAIFISSVNKASLKLKKQINPL